MSFTATYDACVLHPAGLRGLFARAFEEQNGAARQWIPAPVRSPGRALRQHDDGGTAGWGAGL